jgi:serine protease Do
MKILYVGLSLFLTLRLTCDAKAVSPDRQSNLYAMTTAEVEEVTIEWLDRHGFDVLRQSRSNQSIDLIAGKNNERLRVRAESHSPVAAEVRIEPIQGRSQPIVAELQRYLDDYSKMPDLGPGQDTGSVPDLVHGYLDAVACLYAHWAGEQVQITGFAVDKAGLIISTGHDLKIGEHVSILFSDGRQFAGRVIKLDHTLDLALIRTPVTLKAVVPLMNGRFTLQNGDRLFAITCPKGAIAGIETGFLDGPPRRINGLPLWQVQLAVSHGSSGSPVFDSQGRLAAIVKGRFRGTDSIGFLIPFEIILQFLEKY